MRRSISSQRPNVIFARNEDDDDHSSDDEEMFFAVLEFSSEEFKLVDP